MTLPGNLSLNPDAFPAALVYGPLGAGKLRLQGDHWG